MKNIIPQSLLIFLVLIASFFIIIPNSFAHSGDEFSAWAVITPTIDGTLATGEWVDADRVDFTLAYCAESHDVTLYVKNDATYLYLAVVVRNEEYSNLAEMYHDFANFYFDNNNNGATDIGEDGLAIRFDGTVIRDTFNPNGVNGWSYSDIDHGGTNDIDGAVTHTNPVPDGIGDYTFEYRHPLDTTDNDHDFSLTAGDTVGFRFSFSDGETTCQPVSYHYPSSAPSGYADIVIAAEPNISMLFVPLNWTDTQAAFDSSADTQIQFFIDAIPLNACPEQVARAKLDVATQNFNTFACSASNCGVGSISPFVTGLGINPADYDYIIGLIQASPCAPIAGCSNGSETVWVETVYDSVAAHEIGHLFDLSDEYCSNADGSTDCRCNDGDSGGCGDTGGDGAATGDVNFLCDSCTAADPCDCPPDGSNDCTGSPCCGFTYGGTTYDCGTVDYGICCLGNRNTAGGRAIMSFGNVEVVSAGARAFDVHSVAHFATFPELSCSSPTRPISKQIIDLSLLISPEEEVTVEKAIRSYGRPSRLNLKGKDYELSVLDKKGKVVWRHTFDIEFKYDGPRYLDVDYSKIHYKLFPVQLRIPYQSGMDKLTLNHHDKSIFSLDLNFCNQDGVCGPTETHDTCPADCPLEKRDKVCKDTRDGICDPDCAAGIDPDCEGECGNRVCNEGESYKTCPKDCPSGGKDGFCDGVKDGRCDPDCSDRNQDPDCGNSCGDGVCTSCQNVGDSRACENFGNCPEDCSSGGEDNYCDGDKDGICDPDCEKGQDPDCGIQPWIIIIAILVFLLILLLFFWILKRRRGSR